jgi:hypothetical protein
MRSLCCLCIPYIVARQRHGKNFPAGMHAHGTGEELLEAVFLCVPCLIECRIHVCTGRKVILVVKCKPHLNKSIESKVLIFHVQLSIRFPLSRIHSPMLFLSFK